MGRTANIGRFFSALSKTMDVQRSRSWEKQGFCLCLFHFFFFQTWRRSVMQSMMLMSNNLPFAMGECKREKVGSKIKGRLFQRLVGIESRSRTMNHSRLIECSWTLEKKGIAGTSGLTHNLSIRNMMSLCFWQLFLTGVSDRWNLGKSRPASNYRVSSNSVTSNNIARIQAG